MNENLENLISAWKAEEDIAHIKGWDFSHIEGRYEEENDLPWNYKEEILGSLDPQMRLLDTDTGGGEFLLSLSHPYENTSVTEGYLPNLELCQNTLSPLGITVKEANAGVSLPFENNMFDMVINRHGDFNAKELFRVLKKGGLFITQQVGADNDRALVDIIYEEKQPLPFPEQYLGITRQKFESEGFKIIKECEAYRTIKFFDVGALVWFARIIEWEFPGFSVDKNLDGLIRAQQIIEEQGTLCGKTHRFFMAAKKI